MKSTPSTWRSRGWPPAPPVSPGPCWWCRGAGSPSESWLPASACCCSWWVPWAGLNTCFRVKIFWPSISDLRRWWRQTHKQFSWWSEDFLWSSGSWPCPEQFSTSSDQLVCTIRSYLDPALSSSSAHCGHPSTGVKIFQWVEKNISNFTDTKLFWKPSGPYCLA